MNVEQRAPPAELRLKAHLGAAAALLALVASPLVALAATWLYTKASGAQEAGVFAPGVLAERQALQTVIYFAALHGAMLGIVLLVVRRLAGPARAHLRLVPAKGGRTTYVVSGGVTVAGFLVWLAILRLVVPETLAAEIGDYPRLIATGWGALLMPVLCLLAPLSEEVVFRGLLFPALKGVAGPAGAAVLSSLAWAGLHVDHTLFAQAHLLVAGVLLCWLTERTGSLCAAIWCHVLVNTTLSLVLLLM